MYSGFKAGTRKLPYEGNVGSHFSTKDFSEIWSFSDNWRVTIDKQSRIPLQAVVFSDRKYLSSSAFVDSLKSDIVRSPGTCLDTPPSLHNSEGPFLSHVLASQCASGVAMLQKHFRLILPPPVVETASEISNCIMEIALGRAGNPYVRCVCFNYLLQNLVV